VVQEFKKTVQAVESVRVGSSLKTRMRLEHSGLYSFEFYQNGRLTGLISVELLGFTPRNPKPTIEVSIYEKQREELCLKASLNGQNVKRLVRFSIQQLTFVKPFGLRLNIQHL